MFALLFGDCTRFRPCWGLVRPVRSMQGYFDPFSFDISVHVLTCRKLRRVVARDLGAGFGSSPKSNLNQHAVCSPTGRWCMPRCCTQILQVRRRQFAVSAFSLRGHSSMIDHTASRQTRLLWHPQVSQASCRQGATSTHIQGHWQAGFQ